MCLRLKKVKKRILEKNIIAGVCIRSMEERLQHLLVNCLVLEWFINKHPISFYSFRASSQSMVDNVICAIHLKKIYNFL